MPSNENSKTSMENAYLIAGEMLKDRLKDINPSALGDVESAFASSSIINKVLIDKKESMRKKAGKEVNNDPGQK